MPLSVGVGCHPPAHPAERSRTTWRTLRSTWSGQPSPEAVRRRSWPWSGRSF